MLGINIPTSAELTADGIALEDHAAAKLEAVIHGALDRLNGTTIKVVEGGIQFAIPPKPAAQ